MSRTNYAAAMDARRKLQEIAAKDLGGAPEDYEVGGGADVGATMLGEGGARYRAGG